MVFFLMYSKIVFFFFILECGFSAADSLLLFCVQHSFAESVDCEGLSCPDTREVSDEWYCNCWPGLCSIDPADSLEALKTLQALRPCLWLTPLQPPQWLVATQHTSISNVWISSSVSRSTFIRRQRERLL